MPIWRRIRGPLEDWRIDVLGDWRTGGLEDCRIGGLDWTGLDGAPRAVRRLLGAQERSRRGHNRTCRPADWSRLGGCTVRPLSLIHI